MQAWVASLKQKNLKIDSINKQNFIRLIVGIIEQNFKIYYIN